MPEQMKKVNLKSRFALLALLIGVQASAAFAEYEKELGTVDKLIKERKYQSAAEFINQHKLSRDPRFTRRYVHVLARRYIATTGFSTFVLKDLEPGEEVDRLRSDASVAKSNAVKKYVLDMDELLHQQLGKYPESMDIQFAIGDYLSSYVFCQCHTTKYFHGKGDAGFYQRAYEAGIYDDWSLLRIGYSLLYARDTKDFSKAIGFLKKSHELNPENHVVSLFLGSGYYHQRDLENAKYYATRALGKFASPAMNADSYYNYAQISRDLGQYEAAEKNFITALGIAKGHKESFSGLLQLYGAKAESQKYFNLVKQSISRDFADQELIGNYVHHLQNHGLNEIDNRLVEWLATVKPDKPIEVGVLNFNLGFIHQNFDDGVKAEHYYLKSLAGFKKMKKPPVESIHEVERMLGWLGKRS